MTRARTGGCAGSCAHPAVCGDAPLGQAGGEIAPGLSPRRGAYVQMQTQTVGRRPGLASKAECHQIRTLMCVKEETHFDEASFS
jgi:hypothetical protein